MSNKFSVIVSDPPWGFSDKLQQSDVARGAAANYSTMTISQIKDIPVSLIADPEGAILALWTPSSLLQEGLDVMKSWGFAHKQTYIWVKSKKIPLSSLAKDLIKNINSLSVKETINNYIGNFNYNNLLSFGMGRLFRQSHEICLIGINNTKIYKKLANKSQRSVSFGENLRHSSKPENLQNSLDIMFPACNKLEMFARRNRQGWTCIGNQVCNGEDINLSIKKLM